METALRNGLRGRAPAGATEATWAAEDTAATRMLTGTSATRAVPRTGSQTSPHRRLEPMDEPVPRRAPARRASAPPPSRKRSGSRGLVAVLVVLALVAAGVIAYAATQNSGSQGVQLRENVRGQANDAIEELRGLIEDNTQ
jgi:uncharacterized protein HemX